MSNLGGKNVSEDTDKDLGVDSIVAGTNITSINNADPRNPIINAATQAGSGEANTSSNVGAGVGKVFKQKTGVDLELKSIKGGTNITISNDTDEVTINAASQLKNTTKGDLEGFSTIAARIPVGTNGQVLTADSAEALGLKWAAAAGGGDVATDVIFDAKGDLAGGTGADTAARLAVGTNGQVLSADSAEATGLKWVAAGGGGGAHTFSMNNFRGNSTTIFSGSSNASKGTVYDVDTTFTLNSLSVETSGDATATYKCMIVEVSGSTNVLDVILDETGTQAIAADPARRLFDFPGGVTITAGKRIGILIVRVDGTDTAICRVNFPSTTIEELSPFLTFFSFVVTAENNPIVTTVLGAGGTGNVVATNIFGAIV